MVKPPKSMEPESFKNIEKDGQRNAGKALEDDSFRNYMARKISLQRKQFGLALPPDPRMIIQQQQNPQLKHNNIRESDKQDSQQQNLPNLLEHQQVVEGKTQTWHASNMEEPITVDTSDRKRKRQSSANKTDFQEMLPLNHRHLDRQQHQTEQQKQSRINNILQHRQTSISEPNQYSEMTTYLGDCSVGDETSVNAPLHYSIDNNINAISNSFEHSVQTSRQQSTLPQERRPLTSSLKKSSSGQVSSASSSVLKKKLVGIVQFASPAVSKEFRYDNGEVCSSTSDSIRKSLRHKRRKKEKKNRKKQKLLKQKNKENGIGFFSNVLRQLEKKHGRIKIAESDSNKKLGSKHRRESKCACSIRINLDDIFDTDEHDESDNQDFESDGDHDTYNDNNYDDDSCDNLDEETAFDPGNDYDKTRNDTSTEKQEIDLNTVKATDNTALSVNISNIDRTIHSGPEAGILSIEKEEYLNYHLDTTRNGITSPRNECNPNVCDTVYEIETRSSVQIIIDETVEQSEEFAAVDAVSVDCIPRKNMSLRQLRPDLFLMGVVVIVNGYTNPDVETLQRLLHKHGGDLERYETSRVTHIIAEHLSYAKSKMYKNQRKPLPVCYPKWIMDCVAAQKLLPSADYIISEMKDTNTTPWKSVATYFNATTCNNSANKETFTEDPCLTSILSTKGTSLDAIRQSNEENTIHMENEIIVLDDSDDDTDTCKETQTADRILQPGSQQVVVTDDDFSDESLPNNNLHKSVGTETVNNETLYQQFSDNIGQDMVEQDTPIASTSANDEMDSDRPIISRGTHLNGKLRTTGTDPYFLDSFFSASRLSFIGSYKQRTKSSPIKKKVGGGVADESTKRYVLHVDMDCFFASVVLRNYPEYQNKPVAIAHAGKKDHSASGGGTIVVKDSSSECSTCNYEARKFGVKKGMFLGRAKELCPDLIVLKYDFEGYEEVSEQVSEILYKQSSVFDGYVEQVSCDESYIELYIPERYDKTSDVTVAEIADMIRTEIFEVTQCTATVGVGANKLLSKLATDNVKPNKSFVVVDSRALLRSTKLRDLNGVGYRLERILTQENLFDVKDVWDLGADGERVLCRLLGPATGKKVFGFCSGIDNRPVQPAPRKTIGAECSYGVRFDGQYGVEYMIDGLAKEVAKRMTNVGVHGSQVTLKLKQRHSDAAEPPKFLGHGKCINMSKSQATPESIMTRDSNVIGGVALKLLRELQIPSDDIRGMGITVSKLWDDSIVKSRTPSTGQRTIENWFSTSNRDTTTEINIETGTTAEFNIETGIALANTAVDILSQTSETEINSFLVHEDDSDIIDQYLVRNDDADDDSIEVVVLEPDATPVARQPNDTSINGVNDIVLPALSQIHMSQVQALPLDMQSEIRRRIHRARVLATNPPSLDEVESENTALLLDRLDQQKERQHTENKKQKETKYTRQGEYSKQKQQHVTITYTATSDPAKFFALDIEPLHSYMDTNSPIVQTDDAIQSVIQFLSKCIDDNRISDVIIMLRTIRKRNDVCWNTLAYDIIYNHINIQLESKLGFELDPEYVN